MSMGLRAFVFLTAVTFEVASVSLVIAPNAETAALHDAKPIGKIRAAGDLAEESPGQKIIQDLNALTKTLHEAKALGVTDGVAKQQESAQDTETFQKLNALAKRVHEHVEAMKQKQTLREAAEADHRLARRQTASANSSSPTFRTEMIAKLKENNRKLKQELDRLQTRKAGQLLRDSSKLPDQFFVAHQVSMLVTITLLLCILGLTMDPTKFRPAKPAKTLASHGHFFESSISLSPLGDDI